MISIYIVVLNWNGSDDTASCLQSLSKVKEKGFKKTVVVVDNASSDNSVGQISKAFPKIKIIKNAKNLGFTGGNNVGIAYAMKKGADYVLVLNNDTVVKADFLEHLLTSFSDTQVGMVCPKIYFAKGHEFHKKRYRSSDLGNVLWAVGGKIDWKNVYATNQGVDEVDKGQYDKVAEVNFAPGACVLISRKLLETVGTFDEKYYLYFEDTDQAVRARKAGFKVLYDPKAVIWHKVAGSSAIGSDLNDYFITRNRLLFGMRYGSLRAKIALGRESIKMLLQSRPWQKRGVLDAYAGRFGRGSWK